MKQNIIILSFILIFVSCSRKYNRVDAGIPFYNYSESVSFKIKTDYQFLTDEQFNLLTLDTTKMCKFDNNTGFQIEKAIYKLSYELMVKNKDEEGKERIPQTDTTKIYHYYCVGKLNLHPYVNSLIILEYYGDVLDEYFDNKIWLINIKNNHICSIVILFFFNNINRSPCPSICLKNKIFKRTGIETGYYFREYFGDRFPKKDKEIYTTFTIDENGFLKYTKD